MTASSISRPHHERPWARGPARAPDPPAEPAGWLSDGEIHFLWWFIQGSIMNPETRTWLHRAWGMCDRHATGLLAVEAAYRRGWMHASALLYLDLIERAIGALTTRGPLRTFRAIYRLRTSEPCLMCDLNLTAVSGGGASPELLERGRDRAELDRFARGTREFWQPLVCRRCDMAATGPLCRPHLLSVAMIDLAAELRSERAALGSVARHLVRYARSFRWEHRDTETPEDCAGLLEAVGWCSGWTGLLSITGPGHDDPPDGPIDRRRW